MGGLVALQGGVQVASQGFDLAYVGEDGRGHRAPLVVMARTAFELVHEPDPVRMANVRWLAGYRHPRCLRADVAASAPAVFAAPVPLMSGAALLGDPLQTLPTVFHLLWCGRLRTDLAVPLSDCPW